MECDVLLVCVGRKPYTDNLGLEVRPGLVPIPPPGSHSGTRMWESLLMTGAGYQLTIISELQLTSKPRKNLRFKKFEESKFLPASTLLETAFMDQCWHTRLRTRVSLIPINPFCYIFPFLHTVILPFKRISNNKLKPFFIERFSLIICERFSLMICERFHCIHLCRNHLCGRDGGRSGTSGLQLCPFSCLHSPCEITAISSPLTSCLCCLFPV